MISKNDIKKLAPFFADIEGTISLAQAGNIAKSADMPSKTVHLYALQHNIIPLRYQRNIGTTTIPGQIRLLNTTALVIGAGGLGGNVIEQLARLGIGKIIVTDFDTFDETNLNRQLLSSHPSLGQSKSQTAADRIAQINSDVECLASGKKLSELDDAIFDQCDIVFDCLDNIPDRLVLADRCTDADVTLIHAGIASWYAQIAIVKPGSGLLGKMYCDGNTQSDQNTSVEKKLGTPPFTAAATASIMTAQAVKVLTNQTTENDNKIITLDLLTNELQTISI